MKDSNVIDLDAMRQAKAPEPEADAIPPRVFGIRFEPGSLVTTMGAYFVVAVPVYDEHGQLTGKAIHAFNRFNGVRMPDDQVAAMVEPFTDPVGLVGIDGKPL